MLQGRAPIDSQKLRQQIQKMHKSSQNNTSGDAGGQEVGTLP